MNNLSGTIKLDDTYFIEIDPYNFILKQIKITSDKTVSGKPNKNAGQPYNATLDYYPSLEVALDRYSKTLIKDGIHSADLGADVQTLQTILTEIKNAVTKLSLTVNVKREVS